MQAEWRRVMLHNRGPWRFNGVELRDEDKGRAANLPVESVNWNEAQTFIWLMNIFGRRHYRLPSEAEWEYVARAGTKTTRYWGDRAEDGCEYEKTADANLKSSIVEVYVAEVLAVDCHYRNFGTVPVGSLRPNPWGLYDMLGNVAEWVEDCYVNDYNDAPNDGSAVSIDDCSSRVIRGGSWDNVPRFLRAAYRSGNSPDIRYNNIGFRVARTFVP
jgi:formylglycine-generating enzyme required for sulfatase activity